MRHKVTATSLDQVRATHPRASIVRQLATGVFVVFDQSDDAIGDPTGNPIKTGSLSA